MATVKTIKYGMKGDDVSNLQTTLNNLGYNLDVDGSYGPQTLAAVKDYQAKNNLTVDGLVGPQTQAALYKNNTSPTDPIAQTPADLPQDSEPTASQLSGSGSKSKSTIDYGDFSYEDFSYGDYSESETVQQAFAALEAVKAAQPGAYQSKWQDQIDGIIGRILNREKFSYDVNEDALYQQYKDQYVQGGKMAMQDTMGQAAAMTGGYGNSYAATVGNQAYQNYLSQLNEVVPELYGMALDRYNMEGEEMYNQYGLLSDQEQQDYSRYMDNYNQWLSERNYATGRYDSERDYDYGQYSDERNFAYGKYADDKNYAYNEYVQNIANQKWQAEYDETVTQNEIGNEQWATSRQDALDSAAKAYAREDAMTILANGGTPSDAQLEAAGMSKEVADAYAKAVSAASAGGAGGSGGSSKTEEEAMLTDQGKIEDWTLAVLDAETYEMADIYLKRLNMVDPDLAAALYEQWLKEHGGLLDGADTTVATGGGNSGGRGSGGLAGVNVHIKN
ncbi:MAG: peptidoglycan-binding protein [Eubacteriales bacterium]